MADGKLEDNMIQSRKRGLFGVETSFQKSVKDCSSDDLSLLVGTVHLSSSVLRRQMVEKRDGEKKKHQQMMQHDLILKLRFLN